MVNNLLKINTQLLIGISFGLAFVLSIFATYLWVLIPMILAIYLFLLYGKKLILSTILINYLSITADSVGTLRIYINFIATGFLVIMFLKEFGFNPKSYPKVPQEMVIFVVALFTCLFLSSYFSVEQKTGFYTMLTVLAFFTICYLFYALLDNNKNIYLYIYAIFVSVFIISIRMFLDLYQLGFQGYITRSILNENIKLYSVAVYTGAVLFFISTTLVVALFFVKPIKKKIYYFFLSALFIFNIIILILSNSRGLIVSALISISFILLMIRKSLFIKVLFSTIIISSVAFFTIPILEETSKLYFRSGTTLREEFWQVGVGVIMDHPVIGVGPNAFDRYFYNYANSSLITLYDWKPGRHTPHNFFLYFMAENGVFGLIIAISLFVLFFNLAKKAIRLAKKTENKELILLIAITGIGTGLFVRSFIEVTGYLYYGALTTDLPFWLCFGILISIYQKLKTKT